MLEKDISKITPEILAGDINRYQGLGYTIKKIKMEAINQGIPELLINKALKIIEEESLKKDTHTPMFRLGITFVLLAIMVVLFLIFLKESN